MADTIGPAEAPRRPDWAALGVAALLIDIAALIAWDTSRLGAGGAYARIGPQTVPLVVALCLAGLATWTAIEAIRGDFPKREPQNIGPALWIIGGLIVQMALLRAAGFTVATGLLFAMTARGFGRVNIAVALLAGIVLAGFVWFVFARLLQLSLPSATVESWIAPGGDWVLGIAGSFVQYFWAGIVGGFEFIWSTTLDRYF